MSTIKTGTTLTTAYQVVGDTTGALVIQTGASPTTAMTIDTSQNVGIGTSSFTYSAAGRGLLEINGASTSALMALKVGNTACSYFAASTSQAELAAVGASSPLLFTTNNAERARIDTSGNVGIGTSSPVTKLQVANGNVTATGYSFLGASSATLGVVTTNAALHSISGDTTTYGYGVSTNTSGGLDIMANQAGQPIRFWCGTSNASPTKRLTLDQSGNLLVHTANAGIVFNKTGALNNSTLDDYEYGSWTPTLPGGGTVTVATSCTYVKVGRLVTVTGYINVAPTNDGTSFQIGGLPFANSYSSYSAGGWGYSGALNIAPWQGPLVIAGGSYIYIHRRDGSTATIANNYFGGTNQPLIFTVSYLAL